MNALFVLQSDSVGEWKSVPNSFTPSGYSRRYICISMICNRPTICTFFSHATLWGLPKAKALVLQTSSQRCSYFFAKAKQTYWEGPYEIHAPLSTTQVPALVLWGSSFDCLGSPLARLDFQGISTDHGLMCARCWHNNMPFDMFLRQFYYAKILKFISITRRCANILSVAYTNNDESDLHIHLQCNLQHSEVLQNTLIFTNCTNIRMQKLCLSMENVWTFIEADKVGWIWQVVTAKGQAIAAYAMAKAKSLGKQNNASVSKTDPTVSTSKNAEPSDLKFQRKLQLTDAVLACQEGIISTQSDPNIKMIIEQQVQRYLTCLRKMDTDDEDFLTELSHVQTCKERANYNSFLYNLRDFLTKYHTWVAGEDSAKSTQSRCSLINSKCVVLALGRLAFLPNRTR